MVAELLRRDEGRAGGRDIVGSDLHDRLHYSGTGVSLPTPEKTGQKIGPEVCEQEVGGRGMCLGVWGQMSSGRLDVVSIMLGEMSLVLGSDSMLAVVRPCGSLLRCVHS